MNTRERIELCKKFANVEGTEIGDAVGALASAASILNGLADEHHTQLTLLTAENICRRHMNWIKNNSPDYELYDEVPGDVYSHFTGGAKKLTEEEWNKTFNSR